MEWRLQTGIVRRVGFVRLVEGETFLLQQNLELIVQYPESGGYLCRGFVGLHLAVPAYVVFDGAAPSDQGLSSQLGQAFCAELLRHVGVQEHATMPCTGIRSAVSCHAMREPSCRKLLVCSSGIVTATGGGGFPSPSAKQKWLHNASDASWEVVPVIPQGAAPAQYLPAAWRGINTCFWNGDQTAVLGPVMQRIGLTTEDSRLFISYVRQDSTAIADQLFEALTKEGFDVFLDRCSVPVGVQFQERLMQDLCDKAIVVLLNSTGVVKSKWVEAEIATVKAYRLGLLDVRFPGVPERPDIDTDLTEVLAPADLVPAGGQYAVGANCLSANALTNIVQRIKMIHGRALHRRRYELIDSFAAALVASGKSAQLTPEGTFLVGTGPDAVVGLSVRTPELGDFCALHQRGGISSALPGYLISPAPLFLAQRQAQVSWLGGLSNISHVNEAEMLKLAQKI